MDVVLRDPTGAQLVATRVPRGAPLPTLPPEDRQARAAIEHGATFLSDVYASGMTHPYLVRVVVPATFGSGDTVAPGYALEVAFPPQIISAWLDTSRLPPGWMVLVVGRNGQIITHNGNPDTYVGRGARRLADGEDGGPGAARPRRPPLSGIFTRLPSGWAVKVGAADRVLARPLRMTFVWLGVAWPADPGRA